MGPIDDHIKKHLDILFVGFNPSLRSGETGYHFANPNNRFWTILHRAGLTDRKLHPSEGEQLVDMGYGLTNIVARPTKAAEDITKEEYEEGKEILKEKIARYEPAFVCFVGKGVYQQYSGRKQVPWGLQEMSVVPGVYDFVAPSSSGLVRIKLDDIVAIYKELSRLLEVYKEKGKEGVEEWK
ncbi:G/U mismatch-specific DNA glycosylase [Bacillus thermotolerans]|uniref:G:T/U mismatch-specific uracil/thymine DNA-glycosylase n=1 Tax=Bacillus thermotolerans TaxID=1221996 RepID=A0A0F5HTW5_BACTR|nr:G/U mismatch-specific DNA glycosylase [Bacillus thermotolerans]KKB33863.1 G:T/U mismatch-specific uracil/thymine DNA-glycosylase [Bacillus thermotolerans]KKB36736.1 G:T/U mismatch-specific uracil/thymine DNA-glycosylase [Bacillus thermotolerans]